MFQNQWQLTDPQIKTFGRLALEDVLCPANEGLGTGPGEPSWPGTESNRNLYLWVASSFAASRHPAGEEDGARNGFKPIHIDVDGTVFGYGGHRLSA